ncbi:MAG: MotA/TolQ/ExbB proton channel family protein [Bacteroidia bacterium]|nr:MotA/TolQ/ExbB proton channel family protein [Bacteroidia bacterium]
MLFLLQIQPTVEEAAATGAPKSIFDMLLAGGWTMIPLVVLLFIAIFIYIERYRTIKQSDTDSEDFMEKVRAHVLAGNIQAAKGLCDSKNDPFSRMIRKGIERLGSSSLKDIEASIENVGKLEVYRMERRLSMLATIAGAGPMLGFFGTVIGMIKAFLAIEESGGVVDASDLAGGISEAMVTTAAGLVVGIVAYLAYNTLVGMVSKVMYKLELTSTSFIDILQEPAG